MRSVKETALSAHLFFYSLVCNRIYITQGEDSATEERMHLRFRFMQNSGSFTIKMVCVF